MTAPPPAASSTTFHLFARLPAEPRTLIWRYALPEKDDPALFFYKKGCWLTTVVDEDDALPDRLEVALLFHHFLLDHVEVNIPMVFVNFEARGIGLAWAREQGIQMYFCEDRRCYILVRAFDPVRDAFCIMSDKYLDFCKEPYDCMFHPDKEGYFFDTHSVIKRIALPTCLIQEYHTAISDLFQWYMSLEEVLIINQQPPDLGNDDTKRPRRWELQGNPRKTFTWEAEHSTFTWNIDAWVGDDALFRQIERASESLIQEHFPGHIPLNFKIRPVLAVRK